jgi:leucyl aminopeptidase (aminopeptidase T)
MELRRGAETAVKQCLDVGGDDDVLIVTDDERHDIASAIREVSLEEAAQTMFMNIEPTGQHGREPPEAVASAMKAADVVLAPTTNSLSHTQARVEACEAGARIATLPGITKEIFTTSMLADYEDIRRRSEALYDMLSEADEVHVTSPLGTDIRLNVRMKYWHTDTGVLHEPGDFGNLPAGELDGAPVQAEGTIVLDSLTIDGEDLAPPGTEIEITNTKATGISEDCRLAEAFRNTRNASNLAELGIGTNPEATIIGRLLQDEKVMGTCHFAFGDNTSYGGSSESEIHWDGIVRDPTIRFDDRVIMEDGEFMVDV